MVPFPKVLLILYAHVAANNLVGLFTFSYFNVLAVGMGIMRSSTLSSRSSGSSLILSGMSGSLNAEVVVICINGLVLASYIVINCLGFRVPDKQLSALHANANSECAVSNESKSSLINSLSSRITSSIFPRTSAACGTS